MDGGDARNRAEILLQLLAKGARALAVNDAHRTDVEHDGVVNVARHDVEGIGHPLAAHVQFRREIQPPLPQTGVIPRSVARLLGSLGGGFELIGRNPLDPVRRQGARDVPHGHGHPLAGHAHDLADHAVVLDADFLPDLEHPLAELGRNVVRRSGITLPVPSRSLLLLPPGKLVQLALDVVVVVFLLLLLLGLQGAHESLELLSGVLSLLLVGLGLFNLADCVLDRPVGALDNLLGLLTCLVQNLFPGLLYVLQLLLVAVGYVLESLVGVPYLLKLLVQSPSVADNLAEIALHAHIFIAGTGLRVFDDVFRKAHLAGKLERE